MLPPSPKPSTLSYLFRPAVRLFGARLHAARHSIPQLRALAGAGSSRPIVPRGFTRQTAQADGVTVEWLIPPQATAPIVMLYLHGGAWALGWYNSHRWLVAHLAQAVPCRALAVDYRLAPEHPFPAALDDCLTAYRWLVRHGTPPAHIVLAGDSAGGNLTLAVLMALRQAGEPLPAVAVCLSPVTDLTANGVPFHITADPVLTLPFVQTMARHYVGTHDARAPLISPHYGDFTDLPPLLIQVGENEILLSHATRLAEQARAAGVPVQLTVWPGMWHGWHLFVPFLPEARQAVNAIAGFITARVDAPRPAAPNG